MAKKGATQSPKAGPKPKSTATNSTKATKQKGDRRKSNEPVAAKVADANNEDDWEDESDEEAAPKTNPSKNSNKRKARDEEPSDEGSDSEGSDDDDDGGINLEGIDDSDSESELDSDDGAGEDDDEEEEIDVDELSAEDEEDEEQIIAGTRVRQTINNKEGLLAALRRFALDTNPKTVPFAFHQSVVSSKKTEDSIPAVDDDLQRELAFMNQSLEAARQARALLRKEGVPFTRPTDFFAETVRSDETMQKVKAKLVEEATAKKASAEARKQRDLKKFGKQVQVQKQQERAKQKRETLEKINLLKRKRQDGGGAGLGANEADDLFDVAVDNELRSSGGGHSGGKGGNSKKRSAGDHGPPGAKRQKKDTKYGFGGKKRFGKSGDAMSSGDLSSFNAKRMKSGGSGGGPRGGGPGGGGGPRKGGAKPRLGKSRRQAQAGRR